MCMKKSNNKRQPQIVAKRTFHERNKKDKLEVVELTICDKKLSKNGFSHGLILTGIDFMNFLKVMFIIVNHRRPEYNGIEEIRN